MEFQKAFRSKIIKYLFFFFMHLRKTVYKGSIFNLKSSVSGVSGYLFITLKGSSKTQSRILIFKLALLEGKVASRSLVRLVLAGEE